MTRLLGVIGDPVHNSLSPLIHNAWLRETGINATYEAMEVAEDDFSAALKTLAERRAIGVNITLPHKQAALAAAAKVSDAAKIIGAANTLTLLNDGLWSADNTDAPGILQALTQAGVADLSTKTVTVLGAGGAARAIVYALHSSGAKTRILNRTVQRAQALSATITANQSDYGAITPNSVTNDHCDIIINTTSLGHSGEYLQLGEGRGRLFLDISYGTAAAVQIDHARKMGWRTEDGLGMLVAQAAESFQIWFGEQPDAEAALKRCRAVVEAVT